MTDQDQVNERNCCLVIKGGRLTGRALALAMRAFLVEVPKRVRVHPKKGKQSVKNLTRGGSKVENIEISDECVKSFERIAAKYAVDYSVMKDLSGDEPKHLIFFKSRDTDSMNAAFREYSDKQLCKSATKQPLGETLAKAAEKVKNQVLDKSKEKVRVQEAER